MKMKALGITRKLDELGRLTIPSEIRKANGWNVGTSMEMFMSEGGLVIRKYQDTEEVHKSISDLTIAINGGKITQESLQKAINLLEKLK